MDTLRGAFDSGIPADDSQDFEAEASDALGAAEEEDLRQLPPVAIGQDERRMQVRAYNHWASLLGDATFPSIEDLEPENLSDFGPNSVLLDFSAGIDDPVVQYLGPKLGDECGAQGTIGKLSDVPPRSLLSRITDHYMQILANQAPIGFEAEFVNQSGQAILYRGILLPFSSDDETIDFIFGVINWKEMADAATADELLLEIDQAIEGADQANDDDEPVEDEDQAQKHHADTLTEWADSPAREDDDALPASPPLLGEALDEEEDNVAAFAAEPQGEEHDDDLPAPEFGQFSYDDEYGEEDGGNYSFASLADYIETPAKKAVDLDADRFDPEDYQVSAPADERVEEQPSDVVEAPVEEPVSEEQPLEADDAEDTLDLGGLEAGPVELEEAEAEADAEVEDIAPEPTAFVAPVEDIFEMEDAPVKELAEDAGLYDCLASARELAQSARASEDRSRQALYAAVGRAYDFSLAAEQEPDAYHELIEDSGLNVQDRAPMTPIVKLVFGHDYDKTRLTEYAAVLSHAHRVGVERGKLADFLGDAEGGLKGVVNAERRLRREESGQVVEDEGDVRAKLAKKLRELDEILLEALSGEGPEFSLVMVRRDGSGKVALIGEIADDVALIERAGKRLVR